VFAYPRGNLVVGGVGGGNKRSIRTVVDFGKFQPRLIERAVGVIFALQADKDGSTFIHRAGSITSPNPLF
jgi:hypothetical protein